MERRFAKGPWVLAFMLGLTVGCQSGAPEGVDLPAPGGSGGSPAISPSPVPAPQEQPVAFIGGRTCASCHPAAWAAWAGSDHDLAMQEVRPDTVLGDFADTSFTDGGQTTTFRREGADFIIRAVAADGRERDFSVRYVFGVRPLQQYLLDIGGGRLQAYPVAWDVEGARWISLYPGEEILPDDPLHWSRFALNWNQGCAECHSTNLRKQYDVEADTYETTWSEIDVSCEACHGPGAAHVAWAHEAALGETSGEDGDRGLLVNLAAGDFPGRDAERQRVELDTCAPCHSRRSPVHPPDGWGQPFTESYRPELLHEDLYFADGQIRDEVYVYGSFLQSRMHREGVVCTDCHDPHSLKLTREGDALCTQCHLPQDYEASRHAHHPPGSAGSACVDCHMVQTTYMQVDPRRDHGFHIPRPDLSVDLDVPNACTRCHEGESEEWARDWVRTWFGPDRPEDIHETRVLAAGRAGEADALESLAAVILHPERAALVRATALSFLRSRPEDLARDTALSALDDADPLVRATAVGNLAQRAAGPRDLEPLLPLLDDPSRLVRTEAAQSLSRASKEFFTDPSSAATRSFGAALTEYRRGQEAAADQPAGQMNLGILHQNLGQSGQARRAYQRAGRLEPDFVPARFNLAMLDALDRRSVEAEAGFREVLRRMPEFAEANYSLGLLLAEDPGRLAEAATFLAEAARAERRVARFQYNAGLAAQHLGRAEEAEGFLRAAVNLEPRNPDFANALAILYVQQERWQEALVQVDRLVGLVGARPEVLRMRDAVRRRISGG